VVVVVVELGRELRGAISDAVVESSRATTSTTTLLRPADARGKGDKG
jgi:hypothetical protein